MTFRLIVVCGFLLLMLRSLLACSSEQPPKAPTPADVYKTALTACLACEFKNLPPDAAKACDDLRPVCNALAGVCEEPPAAPEPVAGQ